MSSTLIKRASIPDHARINKGITELIYKLRLRIPDCSRGIMNKGWRSPIGGWSHKNYECPELNELKAHVVDLLLPEKYDFFTWFEVVDKGGTVAAHNHFEHQRVAHYHVAGGGEIVFEKGKAGAWVELLPGEVVIVDGLTKNSIPNPVAEKRIAVVINGNWVVNSAEAKRLLLD